MLGNIERKSGLFLVAWLALTGTACGQFGDYPAFSPHLAAYSNRGASADNRFLPVISLAAHERPGFERGLVALQKPVRGRFVEAELHVVLKRLESESGCPIEIDERALMDAVIGLETLVTLDMEIQPLRIVLEGVLRPHALAFIPKSPGLLVTTQEQVDTNPDYRAVVLYPVYDLIAVRHEGRIEYDYDSLIDLITTTIHPDSWKEGGIGEGTIAPSPHFAGLSVVQTWEVHERLLGLLSNMRTLKAKVPFDTLLATMKARREMEPSDDRRYDYQPRKGRRQRVYWTRDDSPAPAPRRAPHSAPPSPGIF